MTLSNGSKMARYSASISNLPSGGGPNKQGLPSTIGRPSSVVSLLRSTRGGYCSLSCRTKLNANSTKVSYKGAVGHRFN
jgi:hypothetical protein